MRLWRVRYIPGPPWRSHDLIGELFHGKTHFALLGYSSSLMAYARYDMYIYIYVFNDKYN